MPPLFAKARIPGLATVFQYLSCCCFWGLFPMYFYMGIYRDIKIWRYISLCSHKWLFSICGAVSCAYNCALHFYPVFSWPLSFGWITAFQNTTFLLINVTNIAGPWMSDLKPRCVKTRVGQISPATQEIRMALDNGHPNLYRAVTDLPHLWTLPALFLCFFG